MVMGSGRTLPEDLARRNQDLLAMHSRSFVAYVIKGGRMKRRNKNGQVWGNDNWSRLGNMGRKNCDTTPANFPTENVLSSGAIIQLLTEYDTNCQVCCGL